MADEGEIVLQGELTDRVGFRGEELLAPGLAVVKGLAGGGAVIGELMGLEAGEEFAAVPDVQEALAQQGAQRPLRGGIDIGRGNQVGAQEVGDLFGVEPVVFCFCRREWP